ncbi:hypothetical protein [Paracraurococcus lichenis]|uniref:Uncharacterized protein n=1 Tax=Paracraurococcus lichenis TaxID=3064888 RepID=A0ABT9E4E9_9PROT|nr:hypothetical protein [Paracraurococcus sp. LOR1-02]MDO9711031.1 hypothetical protein [Paracraurococcus sp. LOR1-02]
MDVVADFLATLHANNKPQYQGISENAFRIYSEQGRLSVKLHAWAIKAAGFQKVPVPIEFHDVETYEAVAQQDSTNTSLHKEEALAAVIAALHDSAVILQNAANKLRTM